MRKPFWLVDGKLREAAFFQDKIVAAQTLDEARFYFSAFLSAARSVTWAIQVCLRKAPGFLEWYSVRQERLSRDVIAKYLLCARNTAIHVGLNPLGHQTRGMFGSEFYLEGDRVPERNVKTATAHYLALLVGVAGESFEQFWRYLDLPSDTTLDVLSNRAVSLEEIEAEFGLPPGASAFRGTSEQERLEFLKQYSKTDIERLRTLYPTPPN